MFPHLCFRPCSPPAQFFASFMPLVQSFSHVTQRQSLKLLGEVLLDRANFNVMTRYIADEENLKLVMNMLRSKSKNIQFEAFHVFKVRRLSIRFFFSACDDCV